MGVSPADEAMPAARINARKALDIDPGLSEAQAVLGTVATLYEYDRAEAERRFELAVSHKTRSSEVRIYHAFYYLLPRNQIDNALKELRQGLRDDPLNAALHITFGICLFEIGRNVEALREFHEALELDEHSVLAIAMVAVEHWSRGASAEALSWGHRAYTLRPWDAMCIGLFAGILACNGDSTRARKVLETIADSKTYGATFGLTIFHLLAGEIEQALDSFEELVSRRMAGVFILLHTPMGKRLSTSVRWPKLVKSLKLDETMLPRGVERISG